MILTRKQEEGLKIAVKRFNEHKSYTCISGYAGTGKSTLINFIVSALGLIPEDEVCYIAYTGKAANVLKQKGNPNATTAHRLLFESRPLPNGGFVNIPKKVLDGNYKLIVVDEISMLPKQLWDLLLKHKIPVIALGDPAQLPPISKEDDNGILNNPHIFLDEIMRQAKESEIIRLSMHIRNGKSLEDFPQSCEQVQIFSTKDIVSGMYDWADQVICATNRKRIETNNFIRELKGFSGPPQVGDKIISNTNHWDCLSNVYSPLTNGTIGILDKFYETDMVLPQYIYPNKRIKILRGDFINEDNEIFKDLFLDYNCLITGQKTLTPKQEFQLYRSKKINHDPPYDFSFGYAITCWKAQGSQWNKIMLFEENFPFASEEHQRYLYTGITRAIDKIIIIKKE